MYAPERHQRILGMARSQGRVENSALAEQLQVTVETVRRDLAALERRGLVRRVHGGALPVTNRGFEPDLNTRVGQNLAAKEAIAQTAYELIDDNVRTLLIDAGSTASALARKLAQFNPAERELTIVTNSVTVACSLAHVPALHLHLLGGPVRPRTLAAVGLAAIEQVGQLSVDMAFLGGNGLHPQRGLTTPDPAEASIKQAMVNAADSAIALVDASKLGQTHLCRVAPLHSLDGIVTDSGADAEMIEEFRTLGPEVHVA